MNCPHCGSADRMAVKDTRATPDGRITRRRRCPACFHDFMTVERLSETGLHVQKSDSRVAAFDRGAVQKGIEKAAVRRLDPESLDRLVHDIVADVYRYADGPIPSVAIGDSVLRHLREFDPALHIRFALVQSGRVDRGDARTGWTDASDVRSWLIEQYPQLQYYRAPRGTAEVVKRNGRREPYAREKLEKSVGFASKGRGSQDEVRRRATGVAASVEQALEGQPIVTTGQVAAEVLRILRSYDHIAYLRYASAIKDFKAPEDYEAEAVALKHLDIA